MSEELTDISSDPTPEPESSSFADIGMAELANTPVVDEAVSDDSELNTIVPEDVPAPTQQQVEDWRAAFRESGLDIAGDADLKSVAQALAQARQIAEQVPQLQRLAAMGYQVQPHYQQFQQWQAEQARLAQQQPSQPYPAPPQQGQPQQAPQLRFDTPEYDPTWEQLVRKNPETGLLEPISMSVDPSVPQKLQKYYAHQKDMLTKFAANPVEFLETTGIADQFRQQSLEIARQEIQQSIRAQQQQAFISQTVQQHAPWMYVHDQNGQPLTDAQGNRAFWDLGTEYTQALQYIRNGNPNDPEYQDTIATLIVQGRRQAAQAMQPQAQQQRPDPKAAFVAQPAAASRRIAGGARSAPNRIGSAITGNGEPQNGQLTYKAMLQQAFGMNREEIEV